MSSLCNAFLKKYAKKLQQIPKIELVEKFRQQLNNTEKIKRYIESKNDQAFTYLKEVINE